jgi:hypothetical protein
MWPYLFRYRGLVVLHDAQLHHARAWSLLRRKAHRRLSGPSSGSTILSSRPKAQNRRSTGFAGPFTTRGPMLRTVFSAAHRVAVHNPALASELRTAFPETPVDAIRMGVGTAGGVRRHRSPRFGPGTTFLRAASS